MIRIIEQVATIIEPVTTSEAKAHLHLTSNDEDTYIASLLSVARVGLEVATGRSFVEKTFKAYLDNFSINDEILLTPAPLASIISIRYYDKDGVQQTLSSVEYQVDTISTPGKIKLDYDSSWPMTEERINAIEIEFKAGHKTGNPLPEPIKQAILLMVHHFYENRSELMQSNFKVEQMPKATEYLIAPYKVYY